MFYNKREQLKAVFEDTVKRIQSDQFLRESTEKSVGHRQADSKRPVFARVNRKKRSPDKALCGERLSLI